ncbi:MAG: RagB/SusD family nutrient uptake outer membrane protein, partial [Bacteroidetes bacterium]|nr:RagB/SusD family nutrient uptake outer membrane protein [Bacteroidota bacterium]
MKKIYLILLGALLFACNDEHLDRFPQTSITEKNFFNNISDLQTYSFQFYDYIGATYWDRPSDNTTIDKGHIRGLMLGNRTADNAGGWDKNAWSRLRSINYFLDNYKSAVGDEAERNKFAAMGHFARAKDYIGKVKNFSDVPWYSTVLETTDEELYKPRDAREMIVDSIINDLEIATRDLGDDSDKTLLSKWAAYTQLARFCLYEGTFRQYHAGETDLHVSKQPDYFYNKAIEAANAVMESGNFAIQMGNNDEVYGDIFNGGANLQSNSGVIMYIDYEDDKREHGANLVMEYENGISRSMADSYLKLDGTYMTHPETETLELNDAFTNRDPRMKQSLFYPGYIQPSNENVLHKPSISKT